MILRLDCRQFREARCQRWLTCGASLLVVVGGRLPVTEPDLPASSGGEGGVPEDGVGHGSGYCGPL